MGKSVLDPVPERTLREKTKRKMKTTFRVVIRAWDQIKSTSDSLHHNTKSNVTA